MKEEGSLPSPLIPHPYYGQAADTILNDSTVNS